VFWIDSIKIICEAFPKFRLSLTGVKSFGTSVVYLGVKSTRIYELHRKIIQGISPDPEINKRYFELELYEPNMTLGSKEFGMSETELLELKTFKCK
jgi:2'-5' RNA ligase